MKTMEKAGWILFLSGLAVFVITLIYSFGKWAFHMIVKLFHIYNANTNSILVIMILMMIAGGIMIRSSSSQDGQGGTA